MTQIVAWPGFGFNEPLVHYEAPESALNTSLAGRTSAVGLIPGFFRVSARVLLTGPADMQAYEGLLTDLDGTANILSLPCYGSERESPKAVAEGFEIRRATNDFTDDTRFTDGTAHDGAETTVFFTADQVAGSSRATVTVASGGQLRRGSRFQAFTFHEVTRLLDRGNGTYTIDFRPPLPRAHAATRPLLFDRPHMFVRLTEASGARLGGSNLRIYAYADMEFVEAEPTAIAQAFEITL